MILITPVLYAPISCHPTKIVRPAILVSRCSHRLEIQDDPELLHIDGIDRQKLNTPIWFYNKIKTKSWFVESGITESDHDLLMIILKLNIDMGA
jgi:hypothetical protein